MRILLVKTSSLGDLIHSFPAITDAARALPDFQVDWVAEPAYQDLCRWHPSVQNVITVSYRYWRRHPIKGIFGGPLRGLKETLRATKYDAIIDAQGLYKSGVITSMTDGIRHGYDLLSCREKLAPLAYDHSYRVPRNLHAIHRVRTLFASALGYSVPDGEPNYGLDRQSLPAPPLTSPYILFLHGSAQHTKLWPVRRWRSLAEIAGNAGYKICVPWLNKTDQRRASEIEHGQSNVVTIEAGLTEMGSLVAHADGVVGVETGFAHLAAAFEKPTITLYGPTSPVMHGTRGRAQRHVTSGFPCSPCHNKICNYTANLRQMAPCLSEISSEYVWEALQSTMSHADSVAH